jgi:DNA-binding PadR family transcriptional regulator
MSGYDMRQVMEWSTSNFWQESYGQIYPTLKSLENARLIELQDCANKASKRQSKVYALTDLGRTRLETWLQTPSQPQVARNEMLLKIFFSGMVPLDVVRAQLRAFGEMHRAALCKYAMTEERLRREEGHDRRMPLWLITLRYGQAESQAMLGWAEQALEICDASEQGRPV